MSLVDINVWVSALDDPCKISDRTWYINVFNCDGSILKWCGHEYAVLRAPCGHRTIRVPPGCYRINAVWSFVAGDGVYYVNHFTDSTIVTAACGQHLCVKLFNPQAHRCGTIFLNALRDIARQDGLPRDIALRADEAIQAVIKHIPRPMGGFELDHMEEFEKRIMAQEEQSGGTRMEQLPAFPDIGG